MKKLTKKQIKETLLSDVTIKGMSVIVSIVCRILRLLWMRRVLSDWMPIRACFGDVLKFRR